MSGDTTIVILATFASFLVTYFLTPIFIRFIKSIGLVGADIQKKDKPKVAELGGICVVAGFLAGIFLYITIQTFFYKNSFELINILAVTSTVLIITIIGILDCLTSLMKMREGKNSLERFKRVGIRQVVSFLLPFPAAIPLMAVNAGRSIMSVPLIGDVNFGLLYPLLFIPVAIVGASNATNMLAGFNGLEAGLGLIITFALGIILILTGDVVTGVIALTFAFSLLAFLKYNKYPSKIFPGDLNYIIGAVIASIAIVGNVEKIAVYMFIPWIAEFILKLRSKFKAENFGVLQKDGTLKAPYEKTYSLTHAVMKLGRFKEYQVTMILVSSEIIIAMTSLLIALKII